MRLNLALFPHWAALGCLMLSAAVSIAADSLAPSLARTPYLQLATPNSIHVVWRTAGPSTPHVRFGEQASSLTREVPLQDIIVRAALGSGDESSPQKWKALQTPENLQLPKLHSAPVGTFQYEAKLSQLKPATRYFYAVHDGPRQLTPSDPSFSFVTPPPAGSRGPVRFWVIGDSGTGRQPQVDVHLAMIEHLRHHGPPLDFWLHVGDMAYGIGRDMEFQTRVFKIYESTMRNTVCWPTMGNHEGATSKGATGIGPYYDAYVLPSRGEAGGVASGAEAYYSFDHANIHFICLNSHDLDRKPGGAMAKWLKADLEKTQADWLIAFWHHPPYTKGSHDSDKEKDLIEMRQHIMPIIESGGVDLVLTGHSHIYERSMLMDGAYATPTVSENVILDDGDGDPNGDGPYRKSQGIFPREGTIQIVAGHGGQTLGRKGSLPVMKKITAEHGSVLIDIRGDTLRAVMINKNGAVRDDFTMIKRGRANPVRLALPWQPPESKKTEPEHRNPAAPAVHHKVLIPKNDSWLSLIGAHPRAPDWTRLDFEPNPDWQRRPAGFGFGDAIPRTRVPRPPHTPPVVYLRQDFHIDQADAVTELGLLINYHDGFIAYLNGVEVARVGVPRSSGRNAQNVKPRAERGDAYVVLKDSYKHLRHGRNLLAIEAHAAPESLDFFVDAALILED